MLYKALAAIGLSLLYAGISHAQVIYEPVQSQYRGGDRTFYYGGSNPRVFEYARNRLDRSRDGRHTGEGAYGVGYLRRGLVGEPAQYTFSDCAPYRNAIVFGYTSVDAGNDANANVPRFFRMADLLASAEPAADGLGVVVPAQPRPGTIDIRPSRQAAPPPATAPATQAKPVLIIPKKLLEQKAQPGVMAAAK
ncbi:MAG TPA: hypothetical protein VF796_19240 [Humisphaera sp.]